jgi:hypothetical protein
VRASKINDGVSHNWSSKRFTIRESGAVVTQCTPAALLDFRTLARPVFLYGDVLDQGLQLSIAGHFLRAQQQK